MYICYKAIMKRVMSAFEWNESTSTINSGALLV